MQRKKLFQNDTKFIEQTSFNSGICPDNIEIQLTSLEARLTYIEAYLTKINDALINFDAHLTNFEACSQTLKLI